MVPTIMDTEKANFALYCVDNDLLLVSDALKRKNGNTLNMSGITFLWAMIRYLAKPYVH